MEPYQVLNTATMTYSYVIDPNRPPITNQVTDSAYNFFYPKENGNWNGDWNGNWSCYNNAPICNRYQAVGCRDNQMETYHEESVSENQSDPKKPIEIEVPECPKKYTITDPLTFTISGRNVRGIQSVSVYPNTMELSCLDPLDTEVAQNRLLIQGSYLVRIQYFDRRYRIRQHNYSRSFQKIIPVEEGCPELSTISDGVYKVSNIFWEGNRLDVDVQTELEF